MVCVKLCTHEGQTYNIISNTSSYPQLIVVQCSNIKFRALLINRRVDWSKPYTECIHRMFSLRDIYV